MPRRPRKQPTTAQLRARLVAREEVLRNQFNKLAIIKTPADRQRRAKIEAELRQVDRDLRGERFVFQRKETRLAPTFGRRGTPTQLVR